MSFYVEFYSTDKDRAQAEVLRLHSTGHVPAEVAIFLGSALKNLRTDTYERRTDDAGKYIGGPLKWVIHVKANGHLCDTGSNSSEHSSGDIVVELLGPII